MKYSGTTWLVAMTNKVAFETGASATVNPLCIMPQAANDVLVLSNGISSDDNKNQIVIKGQISLPDGVIGGAANSSNPYAIRYAVPAFAAADKPVGVIEGPRATDGNSYGSVPLVLAGANIEHPFYLNLKIAVEGNDAFAGNSSSR